ncbi:MAG: hypothetical protein V1885_03075 [Candidatus Brennerbacteria bacterium]
MKKQRKGRGRYFVEQTGLPPKSDEKKGQKKKEKEKPQNVHPLDSVSDQGLFHLVDIGNNTM